MDRDTYRDVVQPMLAEDNLPAINWLKKVGLLRKEVKCIACQQPMTWNKYSSSIDGYMWRCQVKDCVKRNRRASIRKNSCFVHSRLSLQQWVLCMCCLSAEMSEKQASSRLNVSAKTTCDMYSFFRDVCRTYFDRNPIEIGGAGTTVQIEEACLLKKVKLKQGKEPQQEVYVVGIVDAEASSSIGYMEVVEHNDRVSALRIIENVVRPESTVLSHRSSAYRKLIDSNPSYFHAIKNRSLYFIDSQSDIHMQNIEAYLEKTKTKIIEMRGCKRNLLASYLKQFMWMERNETDRLNKLCESISLQYPLN